MKNNFLINESEKKRILNLHEEFIKEQSTRLWEAVPAYNQSGDSGRVVNIPVDDSNSGNIPVDDSNSGNIPVDDPNSGNIPVDDPNKNRVYSPKKCYTDKYVREAQELLDVEVDGKFGPITLKALKDVMFAVTEDEPTAETNGETKTEKKSDVTAVLNEPVSGSAPEQNKGESGETKGGDFTSADSLSEVP